jgi:hypothetical protein
MTSVRAITTALASPPAKPSPTRASMRAAASRGLSPKAMARMSADFMAAVAWTESGRVKDVTCRVVRFTMASSARGSTRSKTTPNRAWPAGICSGSNDATSSD